MFHSSAINQQPELHVDYTKQTQGIIELAGVQDLNNTTINKWAVQPRNFRVIVSLDVLDMLYQSGMITSVEHDDFINNIVANPSGTVQADTKFNLTGTSTLELQHVNARICALLTQFATAVDFMSDDLYVPPIDVANSLWCVGLYPDQVNYQLNPGLTALTTLVDPPLISMPGYMLDEITGLSSYVDHAGVTREWQVSKFQNSTDWFNQIKLCYAGLVRPPVIPCLTIGWDSSGWHLTAEQTYHSGAKFTVGTTMRSAFGCYLTATEPTGSYGTLHTGSFVNGATGVHNVSQTSRTKLSPILIMNRNTSSNVYQGMPYVHVGGISSSSMLNSQQLTVGLRYRDDGYPQVYVGSTTPNSSPQRPVAPSPDTHSYSHLGGIVLAPFDASVFLFKRLGTGRNQMEVDARAIYYPKGKNIEYDMTYRTGYFPSPLVPEEVNPRVRYMEIGMSTLPNPMRLDNFIDVTNSLAGGSLRFTAGSKFDQEIDPTSNMEFKCVTGIMVHGDSVNTVADVGILVS